jgi:hypothetical protein
MARDSAYLMQLCTANNSAASQLSVYLRAVMDFFGNGDFDYDFVAFVAKAMILKV